MSRSLSLPSVVTEVAAPVVPLTGFLRLPQVLALVPVSKSTLWRHVSAGSFPAPVKLFVGVTAWRVDDVRSWIEERAGASLGFESEGSRRRRRVPTGAACSRGRNAIAALR
ncbi:MAG: AlpA family phage regulatory protein [Rubrivivax sp.]